MNDEEGEDDDSNWEDCEDKDTTTKSKPSKYNTIALKNFIRECERYGLSDRGAAKVANGLLRDLKIVKKGETSNLICPSKVYRERIKWGNKLAKEKLQTQFPPGLYTDGKRVPTLRRETSYTKVGKSLIKMVNPTPSQTWKKIKSFRGHVLSTIKISAKNISLDFSQ